MSERWSNSSTKNGPSVLATVVAQVAARARARGPGPPRDAAPAAPRTPSACRRVSVAITGVTRTTRANPSLNQAEAQAADREDHGVAAARGALPAARGRAGS